MEGGPSKKWNGTNRTGNSAILKLFWGANMLGWRVCRTNFARKIFFVLRNFSRKILRSFPRNVWAFILWVRKNPAKYPPNFPPKNQKKITDELLQERREKNMLYFPAFGDLQLYETWKFRIRSETVSGVFPDLFPWPSRSSRKVLLENYLCWASWVVLSGNLFDFGRNGLFITLFCAPYLKESQKCRLFLAQTYRGLQEGDTPKYCHNIFQQRSRQIGKKQWYFLTRSSFVITRS